MTLQRMTLPELQAIVTDSIDVGWLVEPDQWWNMIWSKAKDWDFGHLINSILENGFDPNCPIVINYGQICEGHHRLAAAILLCLDFVWVNLDDPDEDDGFLYGEDKYGLHAISLFDNRPVDVLSFH